MKILAIRLKNLTSIEGSVEIDFTSEPLHTAGIFAISGPTGAGKSTLLDALCLALYDKTPRFATTVDSVSLVDVGDNQINQTDVRNMLRRGTAEGFAEVDFLGTTGFRYRSNWSVRRARGKIEGRLAAQVMSVINLDTNEELQGTKTELLAQLVQLLGLTYEQFTRTVLLAQNDFATFLKSKGAAKAELLEKLTGTDIYSRISQEVYTRYKAVQDEMMLIKNRMEVIELLPDETFANLLKERETLKEKRMSEMKQLELLKAQLTTWTTLQTQEEQFSKQQQKEQEEQKQCQSLEGVVMEKKKGLEVLKKKWEEIQPDLKKARQLDVQIQSQTTMVTAAQQVLTESVKKIEGQKQRHNLAFDAWNKAFEGLKKALNGLLPDGSTLEQVDQLLHQEEASIAAAQQANDERADRLKAFNYQALMDEQKAKENERKSLKQYTDLQKEMERLAAQTVLLRKQEADCRALLKEKTAAFEIVKRLYDQARLATGKDVKLLRAHLHDDEACPVCGSKTHPYGGEAQIADTLYLQVEQEYNEVTAAVQQLNNQLVGFQRDLKHLLELTEQYNRQLPLLQKELSEGVTEESIQKRLAELDIQIKAYKELEAVWRPEEERIKKQRSNADLLRRQVNDCRLTAQQENSVKEQLALLATAEKAERERYDKLMEELQKLRTERAALLKGMSADDAEASVLKHQHELIAEADKAAKAAEEGKARLSGLQGEIKQLLLTLNALRLQKENMLPKDELIVAIGKQTEEQKTMERQLSLIEAQVLQQEKNQSAQQLIKKELGEKEGLAERWAKLNKLIGSADGTKFKMIAQSYTLNLLLMHANHHLAYLSKRYRLAQIPNTLGLQVVDGDMCDEVRPVYSLSGGESFLVSLALALGLSSLSSNNLKVESLFIDEGFGSLDADSLRTAMEALEQLQMQGRKIGVISHVQEMSERISVQVQVHKKANGKSVIRVVG